MCSARDGRFFRRYGPPRRQLISVELDFAGHVGERPHDDACEARVRAQLHQVRCFQFLFEDAELARRMLRGFALRVPLARFDQHEAP